jgi:oligopeptide transport system substrate-binding protein
MRSRLMVVFSILAVASMLLAACQTPTPAAVVDPTDPPPAPLETLRVNLPAYPDIVDPQMSGFNAEIAHLYMIYEGLTRLDKDLKTVPGAAESWQYNDKLDEITFTLRPGLKYSDGTLINAQRFVYAILRNVNPATAGQYASITDDIKGAIAYRSADLTTTSADDLQKLRDAVEVRALDSSGNPCTGYDQANCNTVKISLAQPAPYFHTVMSLWVAAPVKQELIEAGGSEWWREPKNQVGNGPFIWTVNERDVKSEFIPNPYYWAGQPKYNLEYRYNPDTAVVYNAYKNNELDIANLGAEDLKAAKADPSLSQELRIYAGSCTYAVMFHAQKEPFTDPKIRAAFAYGLNREAWVTDILKGLGIPTLTWIPQGFPGYDAQETRWNYDPEKAKQMIKESSYGSVDKIPPITLTFSDSPRNRTRFEWLANQYKQSLGIDMKLNPVEATAYSALTKDVSTAPQLYILGWCADYPDPQNWLSVYWLTGTQCEDFGYSNPELDKLIKAADVEADPVKRMKLYDEAQKFMIGDVPNAILYIRPNAYLVKPWVKGINQTPMDAAWAGIMDPLSITIQK